MIGLGIDIVDLEGFRLGESERCFRPGESAYAEGKARPNQHLAARLAAKRAAKKALGGGHLEEIEVVRTVTGGGVDLRLYGSAR